MTLEMSEGGLLATLKLQMEGLAILFGGVSHDSSVDILPQQNDETDAEFDNTTFY